MAYVTLDSNGNITGVFANPQIDLEGYAAIDDDDARIATFKAAQDALFNAPASLKDLQAQIAMLAAQISQLSS